MGALIIDRRGYLGTHMSKYYQAHPDTDPPHAPHAIILAQWRIRCCNKLRPITWYGRLDSEGVIRGGRLATQPHTPEERALLTLSNGECACKAELSAWKDTLGGYSRTSRRHGGTTEISAGSGWRDALSHLKGIHTGRIRHWQDPLAASTSQISSQVSPRMRLNAIREVITQKAWHTIPALRGAYEIPKGWAQAALRVAPVVHTYSTAKPLFCEPVPGYAGRWMVQAASSSIVAFHVEQAPDGQWYEVPGTRTRRSTP